MLSIFFQESDVSFVYIDRVNDATLVYRDFYGKRSLILQANQASQEVMFSSCLLAPAVAPGDLAFELPSNSLLVLRSDRSEASWISFKTLPSELRFG